MVCDICGLLGQELGSLTDDRHEGSRWKMKRHEFDLHSTMFDVLRFLCVMIRSFFFYRNFQDSCIMRAKQIYQ